MDKLERLNILKTYFDTRRGCGHTYAMIEGVAHTNPTPMVLVHALPYGRDICRMVGKPVVTIPWDSLDRLKGSKSALVIDNAAMSNILWDALEEIRKLRAENSILKSVVGGKEAF